MRWDTPSVAIEAHPTTYTVLDFLRWQKDGTLDLRPPFQRKSVWRATLKSSLVDSLLRGYPVPALFLQDRTNAATFDRQLVVVDGQQRLRTLIGFIDPDALPDYEDRDDFVIQRVHDRTRAGNRFSDLSEDDRERILNSRLNVYTVPSSVVDRELLEIFRRMNTYGAKLNAQELRNAEYSGIFKEFVYRFSAETLDRWLEWGLFNRQSVAEMRDAEFVSDLALLVITGRQSVSKGTLDSAYAKYEEQFDLLDAVEARLARFRSDLDSLFTAGSLKSFRSRMWAYSIIDLLQDLRYDGPLQGTKSRDKPRKLDLDFTREALEEVGERLRSGDIPAAVLSATRGAATDAGSRKARFEFLRELF